MALELSDHLTLGGMLTLAYGVVRLIERFGPRLFGRKEKSSENGKIVIVQLDPTASSLIQATHDGVGKIVDVVSARDTNGAPLVFAPRAIMGRIENKVDQVLVEVKAKK